MDILLPITGESHNSIRRIYLNMGISYEDRREYYKAFDLFTKWFQISKDINGMAHPKTKRCIETLREYNYTLIATQRGVPIP